MKAVICQNAELRVEVVPDPVPQHGHALLKVLRCGICGSDLHMRHHCDAMKAVNDRLGYPALPRASDAFVFGHEICAEVLDYGPGTTRKLKPGTRVVAPPMVRWGRDIDMAGLSARSNGGYAELMLLDELVLMPVPNGLSADRAALTEPMAVAWHAVRRSEVKKKDVAVVVGCGPVGLGVIAILKARGVGTVIASDFSAGRRALAKACGADVVIDPREGSPYSSWEDYGWVTSFGGLLELAVGTREALEKLPVPWWTAWRLAEALGQTPKRPVVFECVGMPGVINSIIDGAPLFSRIVVVGVCMQEDRIEPAIAIQKEIDLRFVFGHSPLEYRDALHMIADGKVQCAPLVTGVVGLDGVEAAFAALGDPETHAKILIDPASAATEPVSTGIK
ncbi:zinc-binding dehydrogenase [Novosphingobium sp.]|uniref:zinc-binding dehydrogenase n=1 Tax=Novosphingobium sp. TaxID=1874826 RepID=UPI0027326E98|nr:zinc-binding dehydrogenase [Novosphingobium sp.]MDP3908632.1 zinc-binding dehydrogenase [Novosphingobium sp.]